MPPLRMTRAEYEQKYGVKPVVSTSTLDITPAPLMMSRAEYQALYGEVQKPQPGLGEKLLNRAKDFVTAPFRKQVYPGQAQVNMLGDVGGAVGDVAMAVLSPVIDKTADVISSIPAVQKFASLKPVSKGLDEVNADLETGGDEYAKFKEKHPNIARFAEDMLNALNLLPASKAKIPERVKVGLDERVITKRADEIYNIENNYAKTRKANEYSNDAGAASRARIAATDVLVDAVDADGLIRTKLPGGAIDRYRAQTIDGVEDVVRQNLKLNAETVPLPTIKSALIAEIGRSGLEGGDLITALKGVERELQGLKVRAPDGIVPLDKVHDAKISTTRNIDFNTPPETKTYRKAVARAYLKVVEKNSTKFDVDAVNKELSKYYGDIERLENLDGRKVRGGKLGKYFAQTAGTVLGMGAGSIGGPIGSVAGGIVAGEVAGALKGKAMSSTFGRATGKVAPKNAVLERARLSIPDKKVVAPKTVAKTKEIKSIEKDIAKNVEAQKKAIKKGDFTLVQALKEVYVALVEKLKEAIKAYKEMSPKDRQSGHINFGFGKEIKRTADGDIFPSENIKAFYKSSEGRSDFIKKVEASADGKRLTRTEIERIYDNFNGGRATQSLNSNQNQATNPPSNAQNIASTVSPKGKGATDLSTEAKKYKNAEEFYNANGLNDSFRNAGIRGREQFTKFWEEATKGMNKTPVIDSVNPTGGLYVDYTPQARMKAKLGKNMTTLAETMGKSPDTIITVYRGAPKSQTKINPGDFISTSFESAKSYTGVGHVLEMRVRLGDILDDRTEPLGGDYLYRPGADKEIAK